MAQLRRSHSFLTRIISPHRINHHNFNGRIPSFSPENHTLRLFNGFRSTSTLFKTYSSSFSSSSTGNYNSPASFFLTGWKSRVAADPQFPFKVLMEQLVGVSACVLGDMATRPNFGLNELDFVFSTLVVGSILNFTLMYLLAPTISSSSSSSSSSYILPSIFSNCPKSHMFEHGNSYTILNRFGTFLYKGIVFSVVGFTAGIIGTLISNGLIKMRKKMDSSLEKKHNNNSPPPILLNSLTWGIHMGVSSNLRYQILNGIEFMLEKVMIMSNPIGFKICVVVMRGLNNVLGGVSFVVLARLTGSQKSVEEEEEEKKKNKTSKFD